MNVKELKKMLEKFPDDIEVLNNRYSDYYLVEVSDWSIMKGVPQDSGEWVMKSHPTMSEENKKRENSYLYLEQQQQQYEEESREETIKNFLSNNKAAKD